MKHILFVILLMFGTYSCSQQSDGNHNFDYRIGEAGEVLLEIMVERSQVDFPPGKTLLLRLYGNKAVEFSNYPTTNKTIGPMDSFDVEMSQLSPEEFDSTVRLIKALHSEGISGQYGPYKALTVDSFVVISIYSKSERHELNLILKENDTFIDFKRIGSRALSALMSSAFDTSLKLRKSKHE